MNPEELAQTLENVQAQIQPGLEKLGVLSLYNNGRYASRPWSWTVLVSHESFLALFDHYESRRHAINSETQEVTLRLSATMGNVEFVAYATESELEVAA